MASPNEWDLILGENPESQARMLATLLRQKQAMGDLVGLVGGRSFSPWGLTQSKLTGDALENLAAQAYHRRQLQGNESYQQGMLEHGRQQLTQSAQQHAASLAQAKQLAELNATLEREKMKTELERARIMAAARGGGLKMLAPAERDKLIQIDKAIGIIDQSIKVVEQNPNAFGFGASIGTLITPFGIGASSIQAAQGRFLKTPQQVKAHSFVMAQPYEEFHKLAGSQQTPLEVVRTEFLPQPNDDPKRLMGKLMNMRSRLAAEQASMTKVLHLAPGSLMIGSADQPQGLVSPEAPISPEDATIPPLLQRPEGQRGEGTRRKLTREDLDRLYGQHLGGQ